MSAGSTPSQQQRWTAWLHQLLKGTRQLVHARGTNGPAYIFHLHDPWTVSAGGRWLSVRWVGVTLEPPYRGPLFRAERPDAYSPQWPDFTTAIYTTAAVTPPAPPAPKPLSRAPDSQPPFRTDQQTTSPYTPVPDHAIVTVLNGRVKRARERAGYIWIDLESAPERAQRWVEPLKGLPMGVTPHVSILGVDVIQFALNTSISIDTCRAPAPID